MPDLLLTLLRLIFLALVYLFVWQVAVAEAFLTELTERLGAIEAAVTYTLEPVVATAVGGVPEQVEGCGVAVDPRNPEALAAAILDARQRR